MHIKTYIQGLSPDSESYQNSISDKIFEIFRNNLRNIDVKGKFMRKYSLRSHFTQFINLKICAQRVTRDTLPSQRTKGVSQDARLSFYTGKLDGFSLSGKYTPHIFIEGPQQPTSFALKLLPEETRHDLLALRATLLAMMAEKYSLDTTKETSPLLKPTTFPGSNLLANLRRTLPDLNQIRGISINPASIFISFSSHFDLAKLAELIQHNPAGYTFDRQEGKTNGGRAIVHYSYQGVRLFSVSSHVLHFPYAELAENAPHSFDFALDATAELVSKIHNSRPYITGKDIYYHRYVPLIRAISPSILPQHKLSEILRDHVLSGDTTNLVPTKKSKARGQAEYRLKVEFRPLHTEYVLLVPAENKVVIGLDSPIDFDEVSQRMGDGTLLAGTRFFLSRLTVQEEKVPLKKTRTGYDRGQWRWQTKTIIVRQRLLIDSDGDTIIQCGHKHIAIDTSLPQLKIDFALAMVDAIYDGMLFWTKWASDENLASSLLPEERGLIDAIDSLCHYYNLFARVSEEKRMIKSGMSHTLSDMEWLLQKIRESQESQDISKIIYVLREIIRIGQDDLPLIIRNNPEAKSSYERMISTLRKFERLSAEVA